MPKTKTAGKAGTRQTGVIRARVDPALKIRAEAVLNKLGLNASDAIRLLYKQITLRKGLPFDVKIPNAATRRAMKELDEGKGTPFEDFDDFRKAMMGGATRGRGR